MQIDLDAVLTNLDGTSLKMDSGADSPNATLKAVACDALTATYPDEPNITADEKLRRFKLALACHAGGNQEISPEDVVTVRALIGKRYGTLVVGRAFELLDPPKS